MSLKDEPVEAQISRVWDIMEKSSIGMLTTKFDGGLRARPLDARPDRDASLIHFVTDIRGLKDDEIAADPDVCFVIVDDKEKAYLSITGRARVYRDTELQAKIWKKMDEVWWPAGPSDGNARVLTIEPSKAEIWDGPKSSSVAKYEFAKALATGEKPNLGEKRKVTVDLKA